MKVYQACNNNNTVVHVFYPILILKLNMAFRHAETFIKGIKGLFFFAGIHWPEVAPQPGEFNCGSECDCWTCQAGDKRTKTHQLPFLARGHNQYYLPCWSGQRDTTLTNYFCENTALYANPRHSGNMAL